MNYNDEDFKKSLRHFQQMIAETMKPINEINASIAQSLVPMQNLSDDIKEIINQTCILTGSYKELRKTIERVLEPYASMLKEFPFDYPYDYVQPSESKTYQSETDDNYVEIDEAISDEIDTNVISIPENVRIPTGYGTVLIPFPWIIQIIGILVTILIAFAQGKSSYDQSKQIIVNQEAEQEYLQMIAESSQESEKYSHGTDKSVLEIEELLSRLLESIDSSRLSSEDPEQDEYPGSTPT